MVIKKGQFTIFSLLVAIDISIIFLVSFSFFLGFDKNLYSIIVFICIIVSTIFISVILFFIFSKLIKKKYVIDDNCITYLKKDVVLTVWDFSQIKKAEYVKFNFPTTILNGNAFGYIKIEMLNDEKIYISAFLNQVKKINKLYFHIKITK